jgi:hypothetical protein
MILFQLLISIEVVFEHFLLDLFIKVLIKSRYRIKWSGISNYKNNFNT